MRGLTDRRAECGVLDGLVEAVRAGESRVLVVHGEPGVGKTALLEYLAGRAAGCRVLRVAGVQSEMELAFAGLHQLCAPLLDRLEVLPGPQREALRTAFGMSAGPAPDRFLVGLAVLGLLAEAAAERPVVCLVDDAQWLDRASAQVLAFVARRLGAESVGLVFAARVADGELAGLPELEVRGLPERDARALLDAVLTGPVDARVREQIVAETRGNPLALLELPRGRRRRSWRAGSGCPARCRCGRIEDSFRRRVDALPAQARRLLLLAAADPTGDPVLVWRAAGRLGIGTQAARTGGGGGAGRVRRPGAVPASAGPLGGLPVGARRGTGRRCTGPWPRPLIRRLTRIAGPGTGRRPRPGPMRRWPPSWRTRPGGRRPAAGWPRRRPSGSARRC